MNILRFVVLLAAVATAGAVQPETTEPSGPEPVETPIEVGLDGVPVRDTRWDPDLLNRWVEGILTAQFEAHRLAGAVVVVVKDGEVLLSRGFGYANLEAGVPVDADRTLFRLASVTKLFTATAVLQLVERGRLDLQGDVNQYLRGFKIPETYEDPVTVAHLLSHTAGFEDRFIGLFHLKPEELLPLQEVLIDQIPERVRPPGEAGVYSNYSFALAGQLVEDRSGLSWESYVDQHILRPLGMSNSTTRQPLPAPMQAALARGHQFSEGRLVPRPEELVAAAPAGGMSASGSDMARFMLAHLQLGQYGGVRILNEKTARTMQSVAYRPSDEVPGIAYGFFIDDWSGHRVLLHYGALTRSFSGLALIPDRNLGVFVAYNAEAGGRARNQFLRAFAKYCFPADPVPPPVPPAGFPGRAEILAGDYRPIRRAETTLDKLGELTGHVRVEILDSGVILTPMAGDGPEIWNEVAPFVFRRDQGREELVFIPGEGLSVQAFLRDRAVLGFERMSWYQTWRFHLILLICCCVALATTLIFPVIDVLLEQRAYQYLSRRTPTHSAPRLLASLVSVLYLSFLVGLAVVLWEPSVLVYSVPDSLKWMLVIPLLAGALTSFQVVVMVLTWRGGYWRFPARLHYTLVTLAAVCLLWQLHYWNLLGWNY